MIYYYYALFLELYAQLLYFSFFFNDTAPTEIYTLSLHDALPIYSLCRNYRMLGEHLLGTLTEAVVVPEQNRSEEHTSELQSPDHLVCRLLLEKKKKKNTHNTTHYTNTRITQFPSIRVSIYTTRSL